MWEYFGWRHSVCCAETSDDNSATGIISVRNIVPRWQRFLRARQRGDESEIDDRHNKSPSDRTAVVPPRLNRGQSCRPNDDGVYGNPTEPGLDKINVSFQYEVIILRQATSKSTNDIVNTLEEAVGRTVYNLTSGACQRRLGLESDGYVGGAVKIIGGLFLQQNSKEVDVDRLMSSQSILIQLTPSSEVGPENLCLL